MKKEIDLHDEITVTTYPLVMIDGRNGRQKVSIYTGHKILWEGFVGDTAKLFIKSPTEITVKYHFSIMQFGGSCSGYIDPEKNKRYQVTGLGKPIKSKLFFNVKPEIKPTKAEIKQQIANTRKPGVKYTCNMIKVEIPALMTYEGCDEIKAICSEMANAGILRSELIQLQNGLEKTFELVKSDVRIIEAQDDEVIKAEILSRMEKNKYYRCFEIKALVPSLASKEGTHQTAQLCNELVSQGLMEKTIDRKVVYFKLAEVEINTGSDGSGNNTKNITSNKASSPEKIISAREKENQIITEEIVKAMNPDYWYRCAEIKALVPQLSEEEGTQHTARLCNDLSEKGSLEKMIDKKVVYFKVIKK